MIPLLLTIPFSSCQIPLNSLHRVSTSLDSSHRLTGSIPIDTSSYKAECNCMQDLTQSIHCNPTKLKLTEDLPGPSELYENLSLFLSQHSFSYIKSWGQPFRCLDGRDKTSGLSSPGGDIGEFALALLVFQDLSGKPLDEQLVLSYLTEWLSIMDSEYFYMCSDEDAVKHMSKSIGADFNIQNPRAELVDDLLKVVGNGRNIGDSHLRLMIEYPQMYSVRPEVIKHLIKAAYHVLWKKENGLEKKILLDVLAGDHSETAYLEVRISEECLYEGISPLIPKDFNLLINYVDAVAPKRKQLAEFFAVKVAKNQNGITTEKIFKRMNHHGLLYLDITGSFLAKDLPFYTAFFV